jgi:hypothetical protein
MMWFVTQGMTSIGWLSSGAKDGESSAFSVMKLFLENGNDLARQAFEADKSHFMRVHHAAGQVYSTTWDSFNSDFLTVLRTFRKNLLLAL